MTDCLNFGSPEHPDSMWQLVEAIRGLADACQVLEVPVTGGNVSLYNGTGEPGHIDSAIHPTPGRRRARRARRRRRRHAVRLARPRPGRLPAGHHARRARRVRVGRRRARPPRRAAAGASTSRPSAGSPRCSRTPAATTWSTPRTTCRRAASRRRSSSRACGTASASRCRSTRCASATASRRSRPCSPSRTARVLVAVPALGGGPPGRPLHRARRPGAAPGRDRRVVLPGCRHADRRRRPRARSGGRGAGPVHPAAGRGPRGVRGDAAPLVRLRGRCTEETGSPKPFADCGGGWPGWTLP